MTLLSFIVDGRVFVNKDLLLMSAGCAYAGTLLQGIYIHNYFKNFYHETEPTIEND